ncbi:MAG TPA: aldehyde dehydrogenase family protein [Streptosporangiaceae bacterium]|nr:aldehyde dehydrogenase family protein [Streptosporangiaceae bacterium]
MSHPALAVVRPFYGGDWHDGEHIQTVPDKFTGRAAADVHVLSRDQLGEAVAGVTAGQERIRLTPYERGQILTAAAALIAERRAGLMAAIGADTGFTVSDCAREADRAVQTLLLSAEEARRLTGETVPVDGAPGQGGRIAFTRFHPLGVVCAITPFNSPLNTVVHKVGPALAAGNGVVLKPAEQTPQTADALLRALLDAGLPPELISVVHGPGETVGQWLAEDPRPAFYAFTGSTGVGEHLHATIGLRRSQLEMGSLSSTIICRDANLARCADLAVSAGFRKAGQVCTSIQRLYVERPVLAEVAAALTAALGGRKAGDPADPDTFVGPLISPEDAERVHGWVTEASAQGATVVTGGGRDGNVITPTVLAEVTPDMTVMCREIFGPVLALRPFDDLGQAIDEINDTPYGLAAGIFTADIGRALTAADRLRMGSVHINETSSSRVDLMPYTGVKASGTGVEGPRYAIREMSEERLVTLGRP